jgi:hypothetical protein
VNDSKIFTRTELEAIERRKKKDYSDKRGVFSGRAKPKIIELIEVWFPKKKELKDLIKSKR